MLRQMTENDDIQIRGIKHSTEHVDGFYRYNEN